MRRFLLPLFLAAAGLAAVAAPARALTVADTLASDPRFAKMTQLLETSGLIAQLRSAGRVTLFAPTDAAFNRVPADVMQLLQPGGDNQDPTENQSKVQSLVRIHLLDQAYTAETFIGKRMVVTDEAGTKLTVDGTQPGTIVISTVPYGAGGPGVGGLTTERSAMVVGQPILADNGVIFPIDNVLIQ